MAWFPWQKHTYRDASVDRRAQWTIVDKAARSSTLPIDKLRTSDRLRASLRRSREPGEGLDWSAIEYV
jgi:hypothetical protein